MLMELSKSEYIWFRDFLTNYSYLMSTHVLNGTKVSDNMKENISKIISLEPHKGGAYLVPIDEDNLEQFIDMVECNTCSCPGCSLSSAKKRKALQDKLWRLMEDC